MGIKIIASPHKIRYHSPAENWKGRVSNSVDHWRNTPGISSSWENPKFDGFTRSSPCYLKINNNIEIHVSRDAHCHYPSGSDLPPEEALQEANPQEAQNDLPGNILEWIACVARVKRGDI